MSPISRLILFPDWLRAWLQYQLFPRLGLQPQALVLGTLKGILDSLLIVLLGFGFLVGGRAVMSSQYALPGNIQATVLKWAPIADQIARQADIPREVPLVLWFKENSMRAENPDLCTGIIGAYDLVRSGERPCFTPGPISDLEVRAQLIIAADEYKKRCPEVTYFTQNPDILKKCYFAYNAGAGAASRLEPDESAYVMNNYDEAHTNMVYADVELGTVTVTSLGAWPAHLAMQSLIATQLDLAERPLSITLLDLSSRIYDWASFQISSLNDVTYTTESSLAFSDVRAGHEFSCLAEPHGGGRRALRPTINPVSAAPTLTQDVHGCSYSLPGVDITSPDKTAVLLAPMPGEVTTYTDRWRNSTIRIENDEWIVWLLHPRSYLIDEGKVRRGQAVGIMGSVGYSTGPHVHYTIFDKEKEIFVDPSLFLP